MASRFRPPTFFVVSLLSLITAWSSPAQIDSGSVKASKVAADFGKLPISFEANQGQVDGQVRFLARRSGYSVFLTDRKAVFAFHRAQAGTDKSSLASSGITETVMEMELQGANNAPRFAGIDATEERVNYFPSSDRSSWHTDVPMYAKVGVDAVYPGVDMMYHGKEGQLEFDFVVAAKADPGLIRLHFAGADGITLTGQGDLRLTAGGETISFPKPVIYQLTGGQLTGGQLEDGKREEVAGGFVMLSKQDVGFKVGAYDRTRPLIIDPVLTYSTYLGGTYYNAGAAIAADSSGNAYITGTTQSINFPVTYKAYQTKPSWMFVSKMNAAGTGLVYSTYLGSGNPTAIAVDAGGNAYIAGSVAPPATIPVTSGAFQDSYPGGAQNLFAIKLNATGSALVYSTYLGGSGTDSSGTNIAVDNSGDLFLAGSTSSTNFPVTGDAFQVTNKNQFQSTNAFISELNPGGTALVYSTYLGGSGLKDCGGDGAAGIALSGAGTLYVAGTVCSTDFPVSPSAYQSTNKSMQNGSNAFFVSFTSTGQLAYSTYLGGSGRDTVTAVAVDTAGNAYASGYTFSSDFPITPGAFSSTGSAFIAKMNPQGTALVYSTEVQDTGMYISGLAADQDGDAYFVGDGDSGFPATPGAFEVTPTTSGAAVIGELNPLGTSLLYGTFLSGDSYFGDQGAAIAIDINKNAYVTGSTTSEDFPITPGAFLTQNRDFAGHDPQEAPYQPTGFVSKLALASPTPTTETSIAFYLPGQSADSPYNVSHPLYDTPATFEAVVSAAGGSAIPTGSVTFIVDTKPIATVLLDNTGSASYTTSGLAYGFHYAQAIYGGDSNFAVSNAIGTVGVIPAIPSFSPTPFPSGGSYNGSVTVTLSSSPDATIYYTLDGSTPGSGSGSMVYTKPFTLTSFTQVIAASAAAGVPASFLTQSSQFYYILPQTPTPVLSLASGAYPAGQTLTIMDATPNATIRYTTDGTTPTTKSKLYTGPIVLSGSSEIVSALAVSTGAATSNLTTGFYTLQ